jgi:predicted phosphatase
MALVAAAVDPRDGRWELSEPMYRVYFWSARDSRSREFQLSEVGDVTEVLLWAKANAQDGEVASVYAVVTRPELGLVRVAGPKLPC